MQDPSKVTARDVMHTDLLTLAQDATVGEAVSALEEYHVSGAPVISSAGECIGVFSSTDVLKRDVEVEEDETPRSSGYFSFDPLAEDEESFSREDYDEAVLGRDTVGQWMTPQVVSVHPTDTLQSVCARMCEHRVHRVLVMEGTKLVGIITTSDVVRFVAKLDGAHEERGSRKAGDRGRATRSEQRNGKGHRK